MKTPNLRQSSTWLVFLLAACAICHARIWHVSLYGNDANDGLTWTTALASPQTALDRAIPGDELWIAQGIYFPEVDAIRPLPTGSFQLRAGVNIHGGFAGTEASLEERERCDRDGNGIIEQWEYRNETILALPAKIQGSLLITDEPFSEFTCLEGLTVIGGNAAYGGGACLQGTVVVQNCDFLNNQSTYGGAIYATDGVQIETSHFTGNLARHAGGAIWLEGEDSSLTNCVLTHNGAIDAVTAGGGAVWLTTGAQMSFCTLAENAAKGSGTSIHAENGAILRNCVAWGDLGHGQLSEIDQSCQVDACAVTDGGTANLANGRNYGICGANIGIGGIHANDNTPATHFACFWDTQNNDFSLGDGSFLINRAIHYEDTPEIDAAGNPRVQRGLPDIGAYESDAPGNLVVSAELSNPLYYGLTAELLVDAPDDVEWEATSANTTVVSLDQTTAYGEHTGEAELVITYTIDDENWSDGEIRLPVQVLPRPLTVTALPQEWKAHRPCPELTWQITAGQLVAGDSLAGELTYLPENFPSEVPADLTICQGTLDIAPAANAECYDLDFVEGVLHCVENRAEITFEDYQTTYQGRPVTMTAMTVPAGLNLAYQYYDRAGEELQQPPMLPGEYQVTATVVDDEYTGSATANLRITKAPLVCQADDIYRAFNKPNPPLTCTFTGFVADETPDVLDHQPELVTTATLGSPITAEGYPIYVTIGEDDCYLITTRPGTLYVTRKQPIINEVAATVMTYGEPLELVWLMAYCTDPDTNEFVDGEFVWSEPDTVLDAGLWICPWTFVPEDLDTYGCVQGTSEVTIMRRPIRVVASDRYRQYGDPDVLLPLNVTFGALARGDRFSGNMERIAGEGVGTYPIKQGTLTIVRGERDVLHNYELIFVEGTYTIEERVVTITADSHEKFGGQPDPEFTWQVTDGSLLSADDVTGALARTPGEQAGTYAITQGTLQLPETYRLIFIPGTLTITQSLLEIAVDDEGNPQFTVDPLTYGEPLDGPTQIHGTVISTATGEEVPGTFTWDQDGETPPAGDHELPWTFTPDDQEQFIPLTGQTTVTILPAPLTITANDATRAYGTPNPAFSYEITGFVLREDASVLAQQPTVTCEANETSRPGDYAIVPSGALAANYTFQYMDGTLTVTKGSAQGNGSQVVAVGTLTYGQALGELPLDGEFTDEAGNTIAGELVWNDPESHPDCATTEAAWSFTPQDTECYETVFGTAAITVLPAPLTVTANDATRAYGTPNPHFTCEITGFVLREDASVLKQQPAVTCSVNETSRPGDYAIVPSGALAANYTFQYIDGTLTVMPRMVTIQADDLSKRFGATDPELTYQIVSSDGLADGDRFSGSLTRESGEAIGTYEILQGSLVISENYTILFRSGLFTIQPADLEIAKDESGKEQLTIEEITYGDELDGEEQIHGVIISNATGEEVPGIFHWEQDGDTPPAGEHELIWIFTPDDEEKYSPIQGTAVLIVHPALLTVQAQDAEREYAQENPPFAYEISGFVLREDASVLERQPIVTCEATISSRPGEYPITVAGALATNYCIDYREGTLTITQAQNYLNGGNNSWAYLKYGQKLSEAAVYPDFYDSAIQPINGTITWLDPDHYPVCAETSADILFTPDDQLCYKPIYTTIHIRVEQVNLGLACIAKEREYNQENPELTYVFFDFVLDDTEETAVTVKPTMHTDATLESPPGYYGIWTTDAYAPNYYIGGGSPAILTIYKAHLEVGPQGIHATDLVYGQSLGDSELTGQIIQHAKVPLTEVPGTFSWENPGITIPSGTSRQKWIFTPDNQECYECLTGYADVTAYPAPLTVSLSNATRLYGDANPTFQYSLSGFVGDDTAQNLALPPQIECTATAASDVGEYAIRCAESEDGNYQLVCEEGCLTVQPRHLDIVANSLSKSCLEADPELTYRTSGDGLVNGDVLTGHLERDPGEAAGQYTIRQGTLSASDNYATQFTNGTLTIASLKPVLVEAHGSEFIYGQTIGESDYSATFANPVTGEIISGTLTIEAPEFRPWAGSARHRVYFQPDEVDKYTTAEALVRFTIHPRPLHVTINPPVVNFGQDLTSVDYSIQQDDILPGDEISLFFPLLEQGTATLSVGSYPIVATVQSADRNVAHSYEVVMEETCLTVLPSTVEVFADQLSCAPGDALPELTYSVVPNDFEDATTLADTLTGSLFCEPNLQQPGVYPITQGTLATDGNHTLLFHDGILTVRQLHDKVLVDAAQYANAQRSGTATVQLGDCQTGVASVTLQCDETLFDDLPSALNALAPGGTLWLAPTDFPLFNNALKLLKDVDIRCNQLADATASSRLLGRISAGPNVTRLTLTNLEIENNQDVGIALDLRGTSEDLALDIHGCTLAADNALLLGGFTQATFGATDLLFRDCGLHLLPTTADHTHTATLHLEDLTFTHEATSAENFWHIYSENDAIVGDDATSVYLTSCVFDGMAPSSASPEEWSNIQAHIFDESNKFLP